MGAVSSVSRGLRAGWLGFTVACLCCAVAVGVFTATVASRPSCLTDGCAEFTSAAAVEVWRYVGLGGAVACVLGCLILFGDRWPTRVAQVVRIMVLAAGGAGWAINRLSDFEQERDLLARDLPATQQMWLVSVTAALAVTGLTTAALFAALDLFATSLEMIARPIGHTRVDVVIAAVGAAAAVVLTAVVTPPALQRGDDRRNVSASTATAIPVPVWPATLGVQRFEMPWPAADDYYGLRGPRAAGAGFITLTRREWLSDVPATVTAYDAEGKERWRYARTGPSGLAIQDFAVYDNGGVVLIDQSDSQTVLVVALDAVSGSVLWTSNDPTLASVFEVPNGQSRSTFLVARMPDRWTAFDPRTGAATWTIPNPVRCPAGPVAPLESLFPHLPYYVVDGATTLMTINDCSTADRIDLRETAVDPATGKVMRERMVPGLETADVPGAADRWYAGSEGRDGYTATVTWEDRLPDLRLFVDAPTGFHSDMESGTTWATYPPDGSFLMRYSDTFRQYSGSGQLVCEFRSTTTRYVEIAMLADQILEVDRTDPAQTRLRLFDRSDCKERITVPAPVTPARHERLGVRVVPGATLFVLEQARREGKLYGFAPS